MQHLVHVQLVVVLIQPLEVDVVDAQRRGRLVGGQEFLLQRRLLLGEGQAVLGPDDLAVAAVPGLDLLLLLDLLEGLKVLLGANVSLDDDNKCIFKAGCALLGKG